MGYMSNPNYIYVDIRKFSLNYLNRALNPKFLDDQNKLLAPKEFKQPVLPNFSVEKFNSIINFIEETDVVGDVSGDEEQIRLLTKMIYKELINRRRNTDSE